MAKIWDYTGKLSSDDERLVPYIPIAILLADHHGWFELRSKITEFALRALADRCKFSSIVVREKNNAKGFTVPLMRNHITRRRLPSKKAQFRFFLTPISAPSLLYSKRLRF